MSKPIRVTWAPRTNSQREAWRKFPEWERSPGFIPFVVRGALCVMIRPVGDQFEARWVRVEDVKEVA